MATTRTVPPEPGYNSLCDDFAVSEWLAAHCQRIRVSVNNKDRHKKLTK